MKTTKINKLIISQETICNLNPEESIRMKICDGSFYITKQGLLCIGLMRKIYSKAVC